MFYMTLFYLGTSPKLIETNGLICFLCIFSNQNIKHIKHKLLIRIGILVCPLKWTFN